jgi:hypothetical protein
MEMNPNALALQQNPFVQALQIVYGRTDMQMNQLKGVATPIDKAVKLDNIENNLSRIFIGYADIQMDRQTKYRDYDRMDVTSTEAQVGLDIYAEESSQLDGKTGLAVWVESDLPEVAQDLNGMFQRIKMESKAYGILRNIAKYGDCYTFNILGSQGVHGVQFIHPSRVERIQQDGLQGFACPDLARAIPSDNKNNIYKPWDMVHFRLQAYDQESLYGRSMLETIRKTWKSYQMLETMTVLYRLTKAVQRNIFYVDVGQASVEEAADLVQKYDKFLKNKTIFIDPKTNDFKMDFSPATMLQDIIWPVRPGSASKVEQLQNTMNIGPMVDLEHFATKMRLGLGVPKTYFDGEQDPGWNSRDALMLQDARFGRKIAKIQKAFVEGLTLLCQIHYAIAKQQYLPTDAFQVKLGTMSAAAERDREETLLRKAQLLEILINVAIAAGWNRQAWSDYLLDEVYPLPMEFRKKLFTPDPVEERQAELLAKAGKPAKVGSNANLGNKPQRTVTNTGIKYGFKKFGEGQQDELTPQLVEEFANEHPEVQPILEELEQIQEKEDMYNDLKKKYAVPTGFSEDEISDLIKAHKGVSQQLNEMNKKDSKTSWKQLLELGLPTYTKDNTLED